MPDGSVPGSSTLVDMLRRRAEQHPDKVAFRFSYNGDDEGVSELTYGQLDHQARAIGAVLQRHGAAGERVLVLVRPGLEFIAGFFGCLYAGAVAVPVHQKLAPRLVAVVPDARASFALATADTLANTKSSVDELAEGHHLRWLLIEDAAAADADRWTAPDIDADSTVVIQYTSGSTRTPKGVMLTHRNLLHNVAAIQQAWNGDEDAVGVYWLPPHHDMGLVGGILETLYVGFTSVLMSPAAFIKRPMRWLQAISANRGVITAAPNFAYKRCVERSTEAERAALDLSSLTTAMNGAESVRAATLAAFADAFAPAGFRLESFYPVYGLAEASLLVSGGSDSGIPGVRYVDREVLGTDRVVDVAPEYPGAVPIVGCGRPRGGQRVLIVDSVTHRLRGTDEVGEIWLAGPSVAQGYWQRPEETEQTFAAMVADTGDGPFLRTGDLGFLCADELFIAGRVKDLVVIDGHHYYPHTIEATVQDCDCLLASGRGAAFAVDPPGVGIVEDVIAQLVVIQEVDPEHLGGADLDSVMASIRSAVTQHHRVEPYAVVLVEPLSIPTTSSGKIQRYRCRQQYLDETLAVVARWGGPVPQGPSLADLEAATEIVTQLQSAAMAQRNFPQR